MKKSVNLLFMLIVFCLACSATEMQTLTVYFAKDKSNLTASECAKLALLKSADLVRLKGHTDNDGDDAYNMELSKRRVETVKTFIRQLDAGIKLETDWYGEHQPLNNNGDESEKTLNRRVEITYYDDPLLRINIPEQQFEFDNNRDQLISCNHGTQIQIPAGAFGNGRVKMFITEYYTAAEIFAANLSTKSNTEPIETAGMIYVRAEKDGVPVQSSRELQYKFPRNNMNQDFGLFTGERDNNLNVNWVTEKRDRRAFAAISQPAATQKIAKQTIKVRKEHVADICQVQFKASASRNIDREIVDTIVSKLNRKAEEGKWSRGDYPSYLRVGMLISKSGKITSFKTNRSRPKKEYSRKAEEFVRACLPERFPRCKYSTWLQLRTTTTLTPLYSNDTLSDRDSAYTGGGRDFASEGGNPWWPGFRDNFTADYATDKIILKTSGMGWINCDRFMNGQKLVTYTIQSDDKANVRLMMKNYKAFFINEYFGGNTAAKAKQGGNFKFYMVPANEEIVVISTKKVDGQLYLAIEPSTISSAPFTDFHYKAVTQAELEKAIHALSI